jgi:hypothetical protein
LPELNTRKNTSITAIRSINFNSMKAWDYYSVPFTEGNKKDKQGQDDNGFYFNHPDIDEIIYTCDVKIPETEE